MKRKWCIICGQKHYAKNFCRSHYTKWHAGRPLQCAICKIPYCGAEVRRYTDAQLCAYHFYKSLKKVIYKKDGGKWGYKDYRKIQMRQKERCDVCGVTKKLIIHHKDENKRNSNWNNLMTVCKSCHKKLHKK